jgi:hypothetical protein
MYIYIYVCAAFGTCKIRYVIGVALVPYPYSEKKKKRQMLVCEQEWCKSQDTERPHLPNGDAFRMQNLCLLDLVLKTVIPPYFKGS